jgi:hypothetical protein
MVYKVVVNCCYGGFNLSDDAVKLFEELTAGVPRDQYWCCVTDVRRDDPCLLEVIDRIGLAATSGRFAKLGIAEVPDHIPRDGWIILDYDGKEWVAEKHQTWHANKRV